MIPNRTFRAAPVVLGLLLTFAFTPTLSPRTAHAAETPLTGRALVDALRQGGLVLFFRHTSTDSKTKDQPFPNFDDCSTQRSLSDAGRADARRVGEAVRALSIPIGTVQSSPFCRARETGQLAFGHVQPNPDLLWAHKSDNDDQKEIRILAVRAILAQHPPAGKNAVLISHDFVALDVLDVKLAEGEAAVVRPQGGSAFAVVGRIKLEEWGALATAAR